MHPRHGDYEGDYEGDDEAGETNRLATLATALFLGLLFSTAVKFDLW